LFTLVDSLGHHDDDVPRRTNSLISSRTRTWHTRADRRTELRVLIRAHEYCPAGLGQLQGGMAMGGFGQLGQQSTGSLGSGLSLGNSGLPINSPSQSVYHTSYGLNSIGES